MNDREIFLHFVIASAFYLANQDELPFRHGRHDGETLLLLKPLRHDNNTHLTQREAAIDKKTIRERERNGGGGVEEGREREYLEFHL